MRCITEVKLFIAAVSNSFVVRSEMSCCHDYFIVGAYNKESFKLDDFLFALHTVKDCRALL